MLMLCITNPTVSLPDEKERGDVMSVGSAWELKTFTCKSTFLDPQNKNKLFPSE